VIVQPPSNHQNDEDGVWVQGVGEPIKLLNHEFCHITGLPEMGATTDKYLSSVGAEAFYSMEDLESAVLGGSCNLVRHSMYILE
jgi:hypothetical protein